MLIKSYLYLPAILLAATIACSNTEDPIIDEDLMGVIPLDVIWKTDSLQTPQGKIVLDLDTNPMDHLMSMQFDRNMEVHGHGACNFYHGTYASSEKGVLTIENLSWTEIACPNDSLAYLDAIIDNTLRSITSYNVTKDNLVIYNTSRDYVVNLRIGLADVELLKLIWRVDSLQTPDEKVVPGADTILTIQFTTTLSVSVGGGICDLHEGVFENPKNGVLMIEMFNIDMTQMVCSDRSKFIEATFLDALEKITSYDVGENALALFDSTHQYVLNFSNE